MGPEAGATATPSPDPAPGADPDVLDGLFEDLRTAEPAEVDAIEGQIWTEWSKSGSAAMDLLLDRGREAMDNLDTVAAIDHFSALIDHAPGFAEAYNARATAFYVDGRYGESLEDLRVALSLNPRHFGAITGLAIIFEDLERPEEALEAWYKVRELSPGQPAAHDAITRLELQVLGSEI
ncbi:tetratricopeptide repeat protein [Mesobaculum littorinae]|uniref:tetratricopeptide repeat protein n=1 Tax=Mesobaculum littorinae TaxID=2486419 RepID=UPI001F407857|nr:tetratricopeptide repeat protein [Mesobaculum littorinae]